MKIVLTISALAIVLAGCATAPMPGAQEGTTPPKLVTKDGSLIWDNAGNFGPVPTALADKGAAVCATLNKGDAKYSAKGYHSKGQDANGKAFPQGAFYCVRN